MRRERGPTAFSNGRRVRSGAPESHVTTALRQLLLEPAVLAKALREHQALTGQRRKEDRKARAEQEVELGQADTAGPADDSPMLHSATPERFRRADIAGRGY